MANSKGHSKSWWSCRKAFKVELLSNTRAVSKAAAQVLVQATKNFTSKVPEMSALPFYTGNLRDSIATVVAESGRIVRASYVSPPYQQTNPKYKPQSYGSRKRIIGMDEAVKAVRSYGGYGKTVNAVLFVGVPYAQDVNDGTLGKSLGNIGFIERLEQQFSADMEFAAYVLSTVPIRAGEIIGRWAPLKQGYANIDELREAMPKYLR